MATEYRGLDPLVPSDNEIIELYRDGQIAVDVHNTCDLTSTKFSHSESKLLLNLTLTEHAGRGKEGTPVHILFEDVIIHEFVLEGGLDDWSTFTGLHLQGEVQGNTCLRLEISSSGSIVFSTRLMSLLIGDEIAAANQSQLKN